MTINMPQTNNKSSSVTQKSTNDPEYISIILASTQGARLFPLTSEYPNGVPKHLLPISPLNNNSSSGGDGSSASLLSRLLHKTYTSNFPMVLITINKDDNMTIPYLLGWGINGEDVTNTNGLCKLLSKEHEKEIASSSCIVMNGDENVTDLEYHGGGGGSGGGGEDASKKSSGNNNNNNKASEKQRRWMHIRVVRLPEDCHGSADALRYLSSSRDTNNHNNGNDESESPSKSESTMEEDKGEKDLQTRHCSSYIPRTSHAVILPGDMIMESDLLSSSPTDDGQDVLSLLVQGHRRWNATSNGSGRTGSACNMLLTNVGAEDKEGIPLKESSKAKTGLLSREEEDMEYIGLSSEIPQVLSGSLAQYSANKKQSGGEEQLPSRRVVLKRSKLEVEEDEGTGSTPKLTIAKRRLHSTTTAGGNRRKGGKGVGSNNTLRRQLSMLSTTSTNDHSPTISLRTDLQDVHVYVISNWVFDLIHARPAMSSFQNEILPLLISRQFRGGVEGAFGPTAWKIEENRERLRNVLRELDMDRNVITGDDVVVCNQVSKLLSMYASGKVSGGLGSFIPNDDGDDDNDNDDDNDANPASARSSLLGPPPFPTSKHDYVVSAQVLSREASSLTLRACTLPSLLFGCSEITSRTLKLDPNVSSSLVPKGAKLSTKFNSILMSGCSIGEKAQTKSCTIGKDVVLGDRTRLNNVLVMDGAKIGRNVVMQNSVVGVGAVIGDNCNLKDCNVAPKANIQSGTKTTEKGESLL